MKKVNLNNCIKKGSKVLSGREEGNKCRAKFKLDSLDKGQDVVEVIVPEELYSINISFFLGMFGNSIRYLGEVKFREKYIFSCDELIMNSINDAIKKALRVSDVLKG